MKDFQIGIIGAGQLGSRHLQALALIDRPISIQVVDPSKNSLEIAKQRFNEVNENTKVKEIKFLEKIEEMNSNLDCVIIATTANIRRKIIEDLLSQKKVNNLILEKVLKRTEDFSVVDKLIKDQNIKTWVNFPRRIWSIYKKIRLILEKESLLNFQVNGSNWDFGCNGLHFLDLFAFLINSSKIAISCNLLNNEIKSSKREGFIEFTGSILGQGEKNQLFSITSHSRGNNPVILNINSSESSIIVNEGTGIALFANQTTNWKWKEESFTIPYQSQLTHLIVQQILDKNKCDLTSYKDAWNIHIPFIKL
ncbi:MAG: hypothetical protein EAX90_08340, partial [Candidatus Heimdallarchaeota archaeon]|nr:hypothetical protein [Candidatus Heimdallarchaeota archaeon]